MPLAPKKTPKQTPAEVRIEAVINAGLTVLAEKASTHPIGTVRYREAVGHARNLLPFWKGKKAADFNQFHADSYRMKRSKDAPKTNQKRGEYETDAPAFVGVSSRTITNELSFLGYAIRRFAIMHGLKWGKVRVTHPKAAKRRWRETEEVTSRGHLARLMWAARGCTYTQPGPWNPRPLKPACYKPADARHAGRIRTGRRHMRRVMLLIYYTGSTLSCVFRLRWNGDPEGTESYVDLENGVLYRLGTDAAPGKQAGMPVPICGRLLQHLRRWRRIDAAAGLDTIVHANDGTRFRAPTTGTFPNIRQDAGFSEAAKLMDLRLLTGRELMEKSVTPRSASIYMGMSHDSFTMAFGRHHPDFMGSVVRALESRPTSVAKLSNFSSDWRTRSGGTRSPVDAGGS